MCAVAVETGRFRFAWIGVPDGDRVRPAASAGVDRGYLSRIVVSIDEKDPRSEGPTGRAMKTGRSYVVNHFMASSLTAPWHDDAHRAGFAASAAFPIKQKGKVVAVFTLYAETPDFFTNSLTAALKIGRAHV